ncbi:MAG: response regulator [Armatimonadota bacterium]|nr:response regulator [Armatimonadota bacterium]MDR5702668.1 response regulator [Armatimonadota bacterium]
MGSLGNVLVVDREPGIRDLIHRVLQKEGYVVREAACAVEAEEVARRNPLDLIILDRSLPDGDGLKLVQKVSEGFPEVSTLVMTGYGTPEVVLESFRAGAGGILFKPFYPDELLASVRESLLRKRQLKELRRNYWSALRVLARAIDRRDHPSRDHAGRVAEHAVKIGQRLGLQSGALEELRIGALLHDIGKIELEEYLLEKRGPLTSQEFEEVKAHPLLGAQILSLAHFPKGVMEVVLYHHERYDGGGYPFRLAGEQIPLNARIVAVAEAFEVMTADRPYALARTVEEALEELRQNRGRQFDPCVVDAFLEVLEEGVRSREGQEDPCGSSPSKIA